jgi:hypothetical protein
MRGHRKRNFKGSGGADLDSCEWGALTGTNKDFAAFVTEVQPKQGVKN